MASSCGSVIKEAIALLDKFSAERRSLDDFMEDVSKDLENKETPHKEFLLDVVSGCIEHKKLLDIVINAFYGQNGKILTRSDRNHFVIVCYLAMFALDDLGIHLFGNIVRLLDIKKMHMFLCFFFANLTTWIQDEWNNVYDAAYVEGNWVGPMLRWRPEIDKLIDQLAVKISQGNQFTKPPIKTTEPQEFSLTKPKPRLLRMPELIPLQEKHKPAPRSTYTAPKEMEMIEQIRQRNHHKTEELLYEANVKQFKCANPNKSEHAKKVMAEIEKDLNAKLTFKPFKSSSPPCAENSSWRDTFNNAANLREEVLHKRQVEEQLQRIESLMKGAREPSSFLQWQEEMRKKDLQEQLAKNERRHLEGLISYEEAAMARTRIMEHNQKTAQLQKEETAQLMRKYAEKRLQEEKEMRDLVQQVAEGHKNSRIAKEKLQKFKQSVVKEVSEQSQELLRQALEEAQAEMSKKFEIIREIRATETLPHIRVCNFDDTETAGHRLLVEMSLAELRERLSLVKEAHKAEQQEKYNRIVERKEKQERLLQEREYNISLHRKAQTQAAAIRREKRKAKLDSMQPVPQDPKILALRRMVQEKKEERQRLKQAELNKVETSKWAAAHTESQRDTAQ